MPDEVRVAEALVVEEEVHPPRVRPSVGQPCARTAAPRVAAFPRTSSGVTISGGRRPRGSPFRAPGTSARSPCRPSSRSGCRTERAPGSRPTRSSRVAGTATKVRHVEFVSTSAWWMILKPGCVHHRVVGDVHALRDRERRLGVLPAGRDPTTRRARSGAHRSRTASATARARSRACAPARASICRAPRAPADTAGRGSCCASRAPGSGPCAACRRAVRRRRSCSAPTVTTTGGVGAFVGAPPLLHALASATRTTKTDRRGRMSRSIGSPPYACRASRTS